MQAFSNNKDNDNDNVVAISSITLIYKLYEPSLNNLSISMNFYAFSMDLEEPPALSNRKVSRQFAFASGGTKFDNEAHPDFFVV